MSQVGHMGRVQVEQVEVARCLRQREPASAFYILITVAQKHSLRSRLNSDGTFYPKFCFENESLNNTILVYIEIICVKM